MQPGSAEDQPQEATLIDSKALLEALRVFAERSVEDYDLGVVLDEVGAQARVGTTCAGLGRSGTAV